MNPDRMGKTGSGGTCMGKAVAPRSSATPLVPSEALLGNDVCAQQAPAAGSGHVPGQDREGEVSPSCSRALA